tara:strand:- start:462 stop:1577 length:1116 start_codon:yes stop_codon:yes gene_type:complete
MMRDDIVLVDLYSGGGGVSQGFKMQGIPTALAVDYWKPALDVHTANHPGAKHIQAAIGSDDFDNERLMQEIMDAVGGRSYHINASTPCPDFSRASPLNIGDGGHERAMRGMSHINNYGNLLDMLEASENPPNSWSLENSPRVIPYLTENAVWNPHRRRWMDSLQSMRMPKVTAAQFGAPTHRGRAVIGEGFDLSSANLQRPKTSPMDFLPQLGEEERENRSQKEEVLAQLVQRGVIDPSVMRYLMTGAFINDTGAVNVGMGGAPWTDEKKGYTWKHTRPANQTIPGLMSSNPATHAYNRILTPSEMGILQGFPADYDWSPAEGEKYISGKSTTDASTGIIGNVFSPFVTNAMAGSILEHLNSPKHIQTRLF